MRIDREGTRNGHVRLDIARHEVVVGHPYTFTVTYVAGPNGVSAGGVLRFKLPEFRVERFSGRAPVLCSNAAVSLQCTTTVDPIRGNRGVEFFALDYLFVTISGGSMEPGDTVSVAYGNAVVPQATAPRLARRWAVEVATDLDGT